VFELVSSLVWITGFTPEKLTFQAQRLLWCDAPSISSVLEAVSSPKKKTGKLISDYSALNTEGTNFQNLCLKCRDSFVCLWTVYVRKTTTSFLDSPRGPPGHTLMRCMNEMQRTTGWQSAGKWTPTEMLRGRELPKWARCTSQPPLLCNEVREQGVSLVWRLCETTTSNTHCQMQRVIINQGTVKTGRWGKGVQTGTLLYAIYTATCRLSHEHTCTLNVKLNEFNLVNYCNFQGPWPFTWCVVV